MLLDGRWRVYEWVDLVPGEVVTGAELGVVPGGTADKVRRVIDELLRPAP
ncbi:hypothetical protein ACIBQ1_49960 [Nonomuraea sp. NPDC050153]